MELKPFVNFVFFVPLWWSFFFAWEISNIFG